MNSKEEPRPSFDEFAAHTHHVFGFLLEFGFSNAPLPLERFVNHYQVRFSNGKLVIIVEGIDWGYGAIVDLEDAAGVRVPLFMFIPRADRGMGSPRDEGEPKQAWEIRTGAEQVRRHCRDLLQGDMTRFYDRAAEWKRMTGNDRSYQKRILP